MAKDKQNDGRGREKRLRKQLQKAEAAHLRAEEQLQKRQELLGKAEARLQRRAESLAGVRQSLAALAAPPAASTNPDGAAPRVGQDGAAQSLQERADAAGIIVPGAES